MAWTEVTPARTDIAVQPGEVSQWVEVESARKNITIEPGEVVPDWVEIVSARTTLVVNPAGMPVCTPGETKCVGYDLYTCSVGGQWQLTEKNSEQCAPSPPPPEERFPWEYIAIAGGAILLIIAVTKK